MFEGLSREFTNELQVYYENRIQRNELIKNVLGIP